MIVAVIVKLGKYVVPDLHIPVAVAAYGTIRLTAAVFFPAVIVNLGTGAAGSCAVLPEVVLLAKAENTLRRNPDFFIPDIKCLVVLQINGRIQAVGIKPHHFGEKFPGPGNGLPLKIISEGEIA